MAFIFLIVFLLFSGIFGGVSGSYGNKVVNMYSCKQYFGPTIDGLLPPVITRSLPVEQEVQALME